MSVCIIDIVLNEMLYINCCGSPQSNNQPCFDENTEIGTPHRLFILLSIHIYLLKNKKQSVIHCPLSDPSCHGNILKRVTDQGQGQ